MPLLLISQAARAVGVRPDPLRSNERQGVLPPPVRSAAGYRLYQPAAVQRVRVVRRAMAVGFTLEELTRVFRARDKGGVPCREVRAMAARKLDEIERRLRALRAVKRDLRSAVKDWDVRLAGTRLGEQARLLDSPENPHDCMVDRHDDGRGRTGPPAR